MSWNTYVETVLEITVGHWPFSEQFQHLANQNFNDLGAWYITSLSSGF